MYLFRKDLPIMYLFIPIHIATFVPEKNKAFPLIHTTQIDNTNQNWSKKGIKSVMVNKAKKARRFSKEISYPCEDNCSFFFDGESDSKLQLIFFFINPVRLKIQV